MPESKTTPPMCPICDNFMRYDGDYLVCQADPRHKIHRIKEWAPYIAKVKDKAWLTWRMRVRLGKLVRQAH